MKFNKSILLFILVTVLLASCSRPEKVLYQELTPAEFTARLEKCPVAYLPLGTLEWHSFHLPLGSDGLQSQGFFEKLAAEAGGIVLPMLFIGPDGYDTLINGHEYYGMDCASRFSPQGNYPIQQLKGSAYWVPDSTFDNMMNAIMKQLKRAGFKIVVAHGHGPSTNYIGAHSKEFMERYGLTVMNCWGDDTLNLCLQCDHAAANETSLMMYFHPELVKMENLPADTTVWPLGMLGQDPRTHASKQYGKDIVDFEVKKMKKILQRKLAGLK
jgi:creatinine amidohydrolase